ncbi:hypothetical protein OHAE_2637 [Ochrobactrum soli]|uniref:Uncharacterized protein n=1 Tax=Ochrobactrum soli TaxID=2448455 RepID=A0A2P9HSD8_9HYPH|nr:hypothetical protein OHAE_2637 [[Ochrobactrum] soli]
MRVFPLLTVAFRPWEMNFSHRALSQYENALTVRSQLR